MWCLGINDGNFHDHSACLYHNSELVYFIEEERLCKQKNAKSQKRSLCVQACVNKAHLKIQDLDIIAIGGDPLYLNQDMTLAQSLSFLGEPDEVMQITNRVQVINHHLAHASSAYRTSGLDNALVIVVDGSGDGCSFSVYLGEGNHLKLIESKDITQSLGWLFEAATSYLGLGGFQHVGKTMALAALSDVSGNFPLIEVENGDYKLSIPNSLITQAKHITNRKMIKYLKKELFKHFYHVFESMGVSQGSPQNKDLLSGLTSYIEPNASASRLAALLQKSVTDCIHVVLKKYLKRYPVEGVCFSGGVALNCKLMGTLIDLLDKNQVLYIPPIANDAGLSMGAALEVLSQAGLNNRDKLQHAYWGDSFNDDEIYAYLKNLGLSCKKIDSPSVYAAEKIAQGKIVAWFQGKMEMGPRALGNRSILARPDRVNLKDRINKQIKNREPWRPFSPSATSDGCKNWLNAEYASPYMSIALSASVPTFELKGVCHIDRTSRVQVLEIQTNPRFYNLIKNLGALIGQEVVLNTSLNIAGMPITHRPYDALCVFFGTPIDIAIFGKTVIQK
ncbi:MAG: hypothetical protein HQK65_09990 [Desulfamplus sp.]|nr:hypothetical protein [Desulfamplus sp.]